VVCAYCADKIFEEPVLVGGECYCSENCAGLARDLGPVDDESFFEESELEALYEDDA